MDLYFLKYNNYYNRQLKVLNSIQDYEDYIIGVQSNVNFNPNDGVSTTQVINWQADTIPDYMIAVDNATINSRWFVIDSTRLLTKQFQLNLYRDTLADYKAEIQDAPIFVEKAMLAASNPLIFNREDFTVNQIRRQPILLKDPTKIPWIVGYIPKDSFAENDETITAKYNLEASPDLVVENISDWNYINYVGYSGTAAYTGFKFTLKPASGNGLQSNYQLYINQTSGDINQVGPTDSRWDNTYAYNYINQSITFTLITDEFRTNYRANTTYKSYFDGFISSNYNIMTSADVEEATNLNGKIIKDSTTGLIYRIEVEINPIEETGSLYDETAMRGQLNNMIPNPVAGIATPETFTYKFTGNKIEVKLTQVQDSIQATIAKADDRFHLEDQPYDMFCIPYGEILTFSSATNGFRTKQIGTALAAAIAAQSGTGNVYDVQILPYCPVQYLWNDADNYLDAASAPNSVIKDADGHDISILIWCQKSNFNFNIKYSIPKAINAVETKVESQCKKYRLVSPNYASAFEFDPQKNGGLDYFRVDCSYKPFNPYIRVAPMFKNLYGYGGNYDSRGLILSGDFSITQLTNAWANYELQNKNYQAIFDRKIQHMEVENRQQRINDVINGIAGSGQLAASGALVGSMLGSSGGVAGAVIGGVAGGVGGVGLGVADFALKEKLRNEAMDYTKDNFGYELGNIQAIPTGLSKTTALTINNPIIPMLEIYDCTYEEKEAFRQKLKYNGMTVMAIGTMGQYSEGYFKGKLIRLETVDDDYHIVNTIASELHKGVYLT